jgi:hypothetical protein
VSRYRTGSATYTAITHHFAITVIAVAQSIASTATVSNSSCPYFDFDFVFVQEAKDGSKGKKKRRKTFRRTGYED